MRRLEEQLLSHDQRLAEEVQRQVAIAMSQQQQAQTVPPEPNVAADHLSQRKSSCASTDVDPKGEFYYDGLSNIDNRSKYDNICIYM